MYIDPNTGGMLFQVLAVLFGIFSAFLLFFSGRIRLFFARMRRQARERAGGEAAKAVSDDETPPPAV